MGRRMWIGALILAILVGVVVGVSAWNAGVTHGLEIARQGGQVVRVIGPGYGFGFFPFGLFLFPLFLFAIFALVRGVFWRGRWRGYGPGGHGMGPSGEGGRAMFDEWHRRQHEQNRERVSAGGEGTQV